MMVAARGLDVCSVGAFALAALFSGACEQRHLLIGSALPNDAGAAADSAPHMLDTLDAAAPVDARLNDGDAMSTLSGELAVQLRALGRAAPQSLVPACQPTCVEVSLEISGGKPPYAIQWDDGDAGVSRTICAGPLDPTLDAGLQLYVTTPDALNVIVSDSSNAEPISQGVGGGSQTCGPLGDDRGWAVCYRPASVLQPSCAEAAPEALALLDFGTLLPIGSQLQFDLVFASSALFPTTMNMLASTDGCPSDDQIATASLWTTAELVVPTTPIATPLRYVHLVAEMATPALASFSVCETPP